MIWFGIKKARKIAASDIELARCRYNARESEIDRLMKYDADYCPWLEPKAVKYSGSIHNYILHKAIEARITVLRKEQEELLV
jgi:hypothetical protein